MDMNLFLMAQKEGGLAKDYLGWSNVAELGSTFSKMAGAYVDYNALRTDASALTVQAGQIELNAKEQANQLRQQFIQAAGSYMFGAAQRGIDVKSASVQSNLRSSAENMGKDIQKAKQNAQLQAGALRTQASIAKSKAKAQLVAGLAGGVAGIADSVAGMSYAWGGSTGTTSTVKTPPIPPRKPF